MDRTETLIASTATPPCSIIIRAFNEERHIANLLAGIRHLTLREAEVVLVDSGSTDRMLVIASQYPVKVAPIAPDQFTFGRSFNEGCALAKGKYLVIVSSHAYPVYHDWLERLLRPFSDPSVALVYGKQRGASKPGSARLRSLLGGSPFIRTPASITRSVTTPMLQSRANCGYATRMMRI